MKILIGVLIILALVQSSFVPFDLVLITLICRAYIKSDKANLFLAFGFGLLISHLNLNPLGMESILYLGLVQITQVLSKTRLAGNPFLIIPLSFVFLLLNQLIFGTFSLPKLIFESLISFPTLYIVRLWEERFIVRRDIKLKL